MAPAQSESQTDADPFNVPLSTDQSQANRRALASVDNIAAPMEEDNMGLQNQPNLAKDSQEMEQILVDLGNSDIVQADLLQAIKTLEGAGDNLSTGDTDAIFPLSGFDLADAIDSEGDAAEDKIKQMQVRLERKCAFLQRRLRILQARAIGKRISEEAALTFEKCLKGSRKEGAGRTTGIKAFLKRIETTANLQASAASRGVVGPKYYNAGSSKSDASKSATVGIASGSLAGLEDTAGALRSHLSMVKQELDSDATLSSSGAESNDEAVIYNNPHQQPMPIEKRALWSWQRARASLAARWGWLQAQAQELEYKVRQHTDLLKQVRAAKGPVQFEGEPVAYEGPLPGSDLPDDDPKLETCARVRPLRRDTFKKRKLLQMRNLHTATTKASKPADIRCGCSWPVESCAVCTGRAVATEPLLEALQGAPRRRPALPDPGYHPVLSDVKDITPQAHLAALSSARWFRSRALHAPRPARTPRPLRPDRPARPPRAAPPGGSKQHGLPRPKRGRPPSSKKLKLARRRARLEQIERERAVKAMDEPSTSGKVERESRRSRSVWENRARGSSSYDIDNIVIPASVAANTRPEILHYKEIITPKWRLMEMPSARLNNGLTKRQRMYSDSEDEDISDAAVHARHLKSEATERCRFLRQKTRRSQHGSSTETADSPLPPQPPMLQAPILIRDESIRPYSPRSFPLPEDTYTGMLAAMPTGYEPHDTHTPSPTNEEEDTHTHTPNKHRKRRIRTPTNSDSASTASTTTTSPVAYECDDPDDDEWDPSAEKGGQTAVAPVNSKIQQKADPLGSPA